MYEYIKGLFVGMNKDYVILENNGIGYKIHTSGYTLANMPKINENVTLFINQIVREDFIGLYGFLTKDELDMFNMLLNINGVGAKAALSLLSISSVNNLKCAILTGDEKNITRAPGIGKKTAQRIILELRDKLQKDEIVTEGSENYNDKNVNRNLSEALEALLALGYSEKEAQGALKKVPSEGSVENIIKSSLKYLMN